MAYLFAPLPVGKSDPQSSEKELEQNEHGSSFGEQNDETRSFQPGGDTSGNAGGGGGSGRRSGRGSDGGSGDMSPHFRRRVSPPRLSYADMPEIPYGSAAGNANPRSNARSSFSRRRQTRQMPRDAGSQPTTTTPITTTTEAETVWPDEAWWGLEQPETTTTTTTTTTMPVSESHVRVTRNATPDPEDAVTKDVQYADAGSKLTTGSDVDYPADAPDETMASSASLSWRQGHPVFHQGDVVHIFPGVISRQSLARAAAAAAAYRPSSGKRRRRRSLESSWRRRKNSFSPLVKVEETMRKSRRPSSSRLLRRRTLDFGEKIVKI